MVASLLSVGFRVPGDEVTYTSYRSDQSMLDADIVIFAPSLGDYVKADHSASRSFNNGGLELGSEESLRLTSDTKHWYYEMSLALQAGRTLVLFVNRPEKVTIDWDVWNESGAESQVFTNYSAFPIDLSELVPRSGENIQPTPDVGILASYGNDFGKLSRFGAYFAAPRFAPALVTKTARMAVGGILPVGSGHLVLLPRIVFEPHHYELIKQYDFRSEQAYLPDTNTSQWIEDAGDGVEWTEEGIAIGRRLVKHFVDIDRALRSGADATPPPQWSEDLAYRLEAELTLTKEIDELRKDIKSKEQELDGLESELSDAEWPRWLLYDTGPRLEEAILKALKVFGFTATKFKDAESEFDVVFNSPEGRFLGEAEGKNRAINIDKLSQLERNIQEDFARGDVADYEGILFGNAHRLTALAERGEFFTSKCLSGARRSGLALVRTTNLFSCVQYLIENPDPAYATACRIAIATTEGAIVEFPNPAG